ncbi:zinc-ribbon domain-containing protein [Virgibacillus halophilus]|uniref:Zinc-ribbon domain-containing protein n=1 Tax=Tigheibacillus halophilus TaxID=361280 RepID=A0ABU5C517_9BACI|nr:zinc-ribbon domain-containing protein [Virgibacillus halophilus]
MLHFCGVSSYTDVIERQVSILYCSNCGSPLPKDVYFCPNCGTALSTEVVSTLTSSPAGINTKQSSANTNKDLTDEIANFVGPNALYYLRGWQKSSKKRWQINFAALFLSFFWLGYRKIYKPIWIGACIYLLLMLSLAIGGYSFNTPFILDPANVLFTAGFHLLAALFGNKWYEKYVMQHIAVIDRLDIPNGQKKDAL